MARWWECKVCAVYLGEYGEECLSHREETGHVGAQLLMGDRKAPPASAAGRARAKAILSAALRDAR